MPYIRKKNGELRDVNGQLAHPDDAKRPEVAPAAPPADIPAIVEAYIGVVANATAFLKGKTEFKNADLNAIASLGRAVAQLQAVEEARTARLGDKRLQDMTTAELRALHSGRGEVLAAPEYVEADAETGLSNPPPALEAEKDNTAW